VIDRRGDVRKVWMSRKTFRESYEKVPGHRPRELERKYGKRVRVYRKKSTTWEWSRKRKEYAKRQHILRFSVGMKFPWHDDPGEYHWVMGQMWSDEPQPDREVPLEDEMKRFVKRWAKRDIEWWDVEPDEEGIENWKRITLSPDEYEAYKNRYEVTVEDNDGNVLDSEEGDIDGL